MANREAIRKEVAWIVYGSVLGLLGGVIGNLWSSYFVKWLETSGHRNWTLTLILSSIAFVIAIVFMSYWAIRQIRRMY